jgi:hypothetical protein
MPTPQEIDADLERSIADMDVSNVKPRPADNVVQLQKEVTAEMRRRDMTPKAKIAREREAVREALAVQRHELEVLESAKTVVLRKVEETCQAAVNSATQSIAHYEREIALLREHIAAQHAEAERKRASYEREYGQQIEYAQQMIRADETKLANLAENITPAE